MSGFTSPNHTQTPNDLFDKLMKDMSEAELKVVLAAIRQTLGYHKTKDPISLTRFEEITGLSRQAVVDGVNAAIDRGVLSIVGQGKRGVNIYELVINLDQSEKETSQESRPVKQGATSLKSRHTKEKKSETKSFRSSKGQTPKEKLIANFTPNRSDLLSKMLSLTNPNYDSGMYSSLQEYLCGQTIATITVYLDVVQAMENKRPVVNVAQLEQFYGDVKPSYDSRGLTFGMNTFASQWDVWTQRQSNANGETRRGVRPEDSINYFLPPTEETEYTLEAE